MRFIPVSLLWAAAISRPQMSDGLPTPSLGEQPKWKAVLQKINDDDESLGDLIDTSALVSDATPARLDPTPIRKKQKRPVRMFARPVAQIDTVDAPKETSPSWPTFSVGTGFNSSAPNNASTPADSARFNDKKIRETRDVQGNYQDTMNNVKVDSTTFDEVAAAMNPAESMRRPTAIVPPAVVKADPMERPTMQKAPERIRNETIPRNADETQGNLDGPRPLPTATLPRAAQPVDEPRVYASDEEAASQPSNAGKMTKINPEDGLPLKDIETPPLLPTPPVSAMPPPLTKDAVIKMVTGPQFPDVDIPEEKKKPQPRRVQKAYKINGADGLPLDQTENLVDGGVPEGHEGSEQRAEREAEVEAATPASVDVDMPAPALEAHLDGTFEQPEPGMEGAIAPPAPKEVVVEPAMATPTPPPATPKEMGEICPHPLEPHVPERGLKVVDGSNPEGTPVEPMSKHIAYAPVEPESDKPKPTATPTSNTNGKPHQEKRGDLVVWVYPPPDLEPSPTPTISPIADYYVRISDPPPFEDPQLPIGVIMIIEGIPPFNVQVQPWYTGKVLTSIIADHTGLPYKECFPYFDMKLIPCNAKLSDLGIQANSEIKVLIGCDGGYDMCRPEPQPVSPEDVIPTPPPATPHPMPKCRRKPKKVLASPSPSPLIIPGAGPIITGTPTPTPTGFVSKYPPLEGDVPSDDPEDWKCADPLKCGKGRHKQSAVGYFGHSRKITKV